MSVMDFEPGPDWLMLGYRLPGAEFGFAALGSVRVVGATLTTLRPHLGMGTLSIPVYLNTRYTLTLTLDRYAVAAGQSPESAVSGLMDILLRQAQ